MKELVFKKGDRVFDYRYGWGKIVHMDFTEFPIGVQFDVRGTQCGVSTYTEDGRWNRISLPTLSFTEYTLEGFSQERPEKLPELGGVVWGKSNLNNDWSIGHFLGKQNASYKISSMPIAASYWLANHITTKNPYLNE